MFVDWIIDVALLVVLLYVAYQINALPRRFDKRLRALAVEYKNWTSLDDSYAQTIGELKTKGASLVEIGRSEIQQIYTENLFRGMDEKQADKLRRAQLQEQEQVELRRAQSLENKQRQGQT